MIDYRRFFLRVDHLHMDTSQEQSDIRVYQRESSPLDPYVQSSSDDNTALQTQSKI